MTVWLMSIASVYASRIYEGTKKIELRRRPVCIADTDRVIVYEPLPTAAITGWFTAGRLLRKSPAEMWKEHRWFLGMQSEAFDAYFEGCDIAYGIPIDSAHRVAPRVQLAELRDRFSGFTAPQSYIRWPGERWPLPPGWLRA